ncbi:transposable element Tcb2 transposase [Trichonephila clavipes]|nr:transposable element Tcb2 transposase [Trichonephila clavipes]
MTIVFVCGDPVVNASILRLLYSDSPLPQLVRWCGVPLPKIHGHPLALICGTMTAQWYIHDILQPHVLPLIQRLPRAIFQQDNARPHTARLSQDSLRTVTTLLWPVRSQDLSPIKYIWDPVGR